MIVDLCFGRHGVLLNSKVNHIDLRSVSVNMTFTVQLPQHKSIIVLYNKYVTHYTIIDSNEVDMRIFYFTEAKS